MADKGEDLNLPNAVIARLVKETLPDGVIVSKEARTAISKAASVFVLYATSCANNFAQAQKRKTLLAADVLEALNDMEFGEFIQPLKGSLEAFRKEQKGKKEAAAESKRKKAETGSSDDMSPDTKKQKTDSEKQDNKDNKDNKETEKDEPILAEKQDDSKNGETDG